MTKHLKFILLIMLFGLTPLLWFKPGQLITGTDIDFPLDPSERLNERIYTWFPKILAGTDRSNNVSSLPYVFSSFFFHKLGFSLITVEKLTFVLWFTLTGIGIYFLLNLLFDPKDLETKVSVFLGVLIYMFNFYQVFLWVRLQLSISILLLLPIFLGILIGFTEGRLNVYKSLLILSIVTIISGTLGLQPPLMFSLFITLCLYVAYIIFFGLRLRKTTLIRKVILNFLLLTFVFVVSSMYWAMPLLSFIKGSGYTNASTGLEVYSVIPLLNWVSSITSFTNTFRFFGDVPWFDSWGGEPYDPEFIPYLNNPILIILSFVPLFFALLPLLARKALSRDSEFRYYLFFSLLFLIGLWMGKGVHYPLGALFSWAIKYVPLFWIHRAPWQKFTIITLIGFVVMVVYGIKLTLTLIKNALKNRKIKLQSSHVVSFGFMGVLFILGYNYLFVLGQHFPSKDTDYGYHGKYNLGFHHEFPNYIYDAADYINEQPDNFKIILLPQDNTNVYEWGYAGAGDVTTFVLNKGTLQSQYGEGFAPPGSIEPLYSNIVNSIYDEKNEGLADLIGLINAKYILLRKDFRYDFFGDTDAPEIVETKLEDIPGVLRDQKFGEWDFYKVEEPKVYPLIYSPENEVTYSGGSEILPFLIKNQGTEHINAFYESESYGESQRGDTYIRAVPIKTQSLNREDLVWDVNYPIPEASVKPYVPSYYFVKFKESREIRQKNNDLAKAEYLSWLGMKRVKELEEYNLSKEDEFKLLTDFLYKTDQAVTLLQDSTSIDRNTRRYWDMSKKVILYIQKSLEDLSRLDVDLSSINFDLSNFRNFLESYKSILLQCRGFCYTLNIQEDGVYTLNVEGNEEELKKFYPAHVLIKNASNEVVKEFELSENTNISDLGLQKGSYRLSILATGLNTRIDSDKWEKLGANDPKNILQKIDKIGNLLSVYEIDDVFYQSIENYEGNNEYSFSFDFVTKSGNLGIVLVGESSDGTLRATYVTDYKGSTNCPLLEDGNLDLECARRAYGVFKSSLDSSKLHVFLFSFSNFLESPVYKMENFAIHKVIQPEIVLKNNVSTEVQTSSIPNLQFYTVNPTKIKVLVSNAKDPFNLIFNQSFHRGWKAYINNSYSESTYPKEAKNYFSGRVSELVSTNQFLSSSAFETWTMVPIEEGNHYLANGFANSWYIEPSEENFEVILEFGSQKLFYLGIMFSVASLAGFISLYIAKCIVKTKA